MNRRDDPERQQGVPEVLMEVYARSAGRRLSFQLMADGDTARDLSGYAAWVTFWYEEAAEPHVVRAARVDEAKGVVIYDLEGDECTREGIVLAQATIMSPERGFGEHSGEIVAIKVPSGPPADDCSSQRTTPASPSGLRSHDRIDLVLPEACRIELDLSTGESKVVGPVSGLAGGYTFFERSDPGQDWGELFRTVATRMGLPWDTETFLAMMTVFSQQAWERKPPRQHQRYVAGSILLQSERSAILAEIEERELRAREPLLEDLEGSRQEPRPVAESLPQDPGAQLEEAEELAAHIERCRKALAELDDLNPQQAQLKAGLEEQMGAGEDVSPTAVGRLRGWSHEETMSTWQSLQRRAQRALARRLGEGEEK